MTARMYHEVSCDVPYLADADVLVAGGGLAGAVAAVTAARNGARTLLVESSGVLGGIATSGLMTSFNGFRNERPPNDFQSVRGMGQEIVYRLMDIGAASGKTAHGDWGELVKGRLPYAVSFDPEGLKRVLVEMCREAGVSLLFFTYASNVILSGGRVAGLVVETTSGRAALGTRIVVDSTGDGLVAFRAGAEYFLADARDRHLMAVTLMVRVAGVRPEKFQKPWLSIGKTATLWGPGFTGIRADDPLAVSNAQAEAIVQVPAFLEKVRANPGFEECYLVETAAHIGVREGRLIRGLYTVTEQDARSGRRFGDVISISSNPVPTYYDNKRYFFEHEGFDIPYRALVPRGVDGLLLAGRCISCEQAPFQSARSMGPLMAHSQASGTAAALCVKEGCQPKDLVAGKLQKLLAEQGAELGLERFPREKS